MRSSAKVIATAAFAVFLMPTFILCAEETAKPSIVTADDPAADPVIAAVADPPATPMPEAMMAVATPYARGRDSFAPRAELFFGYSYLRAVPAPGAGNRLVWLNGGSTSIAFNLNRYLGLVADFGGFNDTEIRLTGTGGNPTTVMNSSGTVYTYLAGPRLSFRSHDRFTPFAQALFGAAHASAVTLSNCTSSACTLLPSENKFAMTAGGGLDVRVHRHLAIRVIQAEYLMTSFENRTTAESARQNDMRLSAGIVFRFGGNPAAKLPRLGPVTYSCSVTPPSAFIGDTLAVSGTGVNLDPGRTATYKWSADGGTVTGDSSTAKIDTTNLAAGTYTLKGHISEGEKPDESADCTATYVVKAYDPPTVSCSAAPLSLISGDSSTITATGVSPQNLPLTYSYTATSGSITGSGSTVTLSTGGVVAGPVTVTCNVADNKGGTGTGTTSVTIAAPAPAPAPLTKDLCSIHFERDVRRPARVNNEAKACLDEVALDLQRNSDAKLGIVANASSRETTSKRVASQRAANTRAYLVKEKGIDPSRISLYRGLKDEETVNVTLIPQGATLDTTGDAPLDGQVGAHPDVPSENHPQ